MITQYKSEGGTDNKLIKRRNAEAIAQAIDILKNDNLNTPNKSGKKGSAEKEDDVSRRETMNPGYDPTSLLTGGDKTPNIFGGKRKGSLKAVRDTDPNYEDLLKRSTLNEGLRINPMFER